MHMDRVRVLLKNEAKTGKRREGTVIEILERVNKEIVGTFQRRGITVLFCAIIRSSQRISTFRLRIPKGFAMETKLLQRL